LFASSVDTKSVEGFLYVGAVAMAFTTPSVHLGLLGYPLGHSQSPRIHTALLELLQQQGQYQLVAHPPEEMTASRFREFFMAGGTLASGANVTIPYKETVLPWLDALTPAAQAIGAVNTILPQEGGTHLVGDNTDWQGFWQSIPNKAQTQLHTRPATACVLGAGGSARAAVYALLTQPHTPLQQLCLVVRNPQKAAPFLAWAATQCSPDTQLTILSFDELTTHSPTKPFTLLVNTTPVGMSPHVNACPLTADQIASLCNPHTTVMDLIYNPTETKLLSMAATQRATCCNGWGMLVGQALAAFSVWSGLPVEPSWQAAVASLE
jgi:shikimate dehydrogenase